MVISFWPSKCFQSLWWLSRSEIFVLTCCNGGLQVVREVRNSDPVQTDALLSFAFPALLSAMAPKPERPSEAALKRRMLPPLADRFGRFGPRGEDCVVVTSRPLDAKPLGERSPRSFLQTTKASQVAPSVPFEVERQIKTEEGMAKKAQSAIASQEEQDGENVQPFTNQQSPPLRGKQTATQLAGQGEEGRCGEEGVPELITKRSSRLLVPMVGAGFGLEEAAMLGDDETVALQ